MKNTRVIIVEDDKALRSGLAYLLSRENEVSCFESGEAFLEAINNFGIEDDIPTCILLDFQMPGINGVEIQSALRQMNLNYPIIFMSGNAHQGDIIDAWHGGAIDFILKPFTGPQIRESLKKIFSKVESSKHTGGLTGKAELITDIDISPREAEVLSLLGKGHRQVEAAQILGIALRTVKMHRASLKSKLNLNTPAELIRYYDQHSSLIQKILNKI